MSKSHEAFWWSLFSVGGVLAALFIPGIVIVTGFLLPTADAETAAEHQVQITGIISWWPVRALLFVVIFLTFFHCAHRVRHTLMDVGLRRLERPLMAVCYLGALAGTVAAVVVLVGV